MRAYAYDTMRWRTGLGGSGCNERMDMCVQGRGMGLRGHLPRGWWRLRSVRANHSDQHLEFLFPLLRSGRGAWRLFFAMHELSELLLLHLFGDRHHVGPLIPL